MQYFGCKPIVHRNQAGWICAFFDFSAGNCETVNWLCVARNRFCHTYSMIPVFSIGSWSSTCPVLFCLHTVFHDFVLRHPELLFHKLERKRALQKEISTSLTAIVALWLYWQIKLVTLQDRTMRLFDLRVAHAQGVLQAPSGIPTAAFDLQASPFRLLSACLSCWTRISQMISSSLISKRRDD